VKARKVKGLDPNGGFAANALRIVEVRLEELTSLSAAALDPQRPEKLHDMRIAAKRLRYVLELAQPALGEPASDGARTAKKLQTLLGEIHDCDEMLPRVNAHSEQLRAEDLEAVRFASGRRSRAQDLDPEALAAAVNLDRHRGLEALGAYLAARRQVLFERFTHEWGRLEKSGFAVRLLADLRAGPPAPPGQPGGAAP
jgi:CHAD domain-containing protein